MNHDRVRDRLCDLLEGHLSVRERARVDAHLDRCEECATELRELRETVAMLRGLPDPAPPAGLVASVMARIEAGEGRAPRAMAWLGRMAEPRYAAALAAGFAGLLFLASQGIGPGGLLGTSVDPSAERFAVRSRSEGVADVRAMEVRRPPSLPRAPVAREGRGSHRSTRSLLVYAPVASPHELEPVSAVLAAEFIGRAGPQVPLRDLDGELDRLMNDPAAFLEKMRRTEESARRPMLAPLVEQSARRGDVAAIARRLGMATQPLVVPASTR